MFISNLFSSTSIFCRPYVMTIKILNLVLTYLSSIFTCLHPLSSPWPKITQLKIDHNPFAKGFRDNYDT